MMKPFFLTLLVSLSIFWISEDVECENINPKESSLIEFGECPLCGGGTITIKYYDFILRLFLKCTKKCIDITCTPVNARKFLRYLQENVFLSVHRTNDQKCRHFLRDS
ncbi:hypothetical protein LSH36_1325g00020 [Paralvinella palmiformis]|uniref:Uncharacterized protein n=1 Tax=Paralvinella palmiformis TaxID=53620 RepID=A0AAD9MNL9_9ANNE|nr:hypothetical protein LSH36_1325g00020 [Paralvinella palmiformis]